MPSATALGTHDLADRKDPLVGEKPVAIIHQASGRGCIETYTVKFTRDGRPDTAIIYGKTEAGLRFVAHSPDRNVLNELITHNRAGAAIRLRYDDRRGVNVAELI